MYTLCATEKSVDQQRDFEAALLRMLQHTSYYDMTISGLCLEAGYSRKVFYRLFEKRIDVLIALLDHTFLDFGSYQPDASVGEGDLHRFFGFWKVQRPLLDALKKNGLSSMLTERALNHIFRENPVILKQFGADTLMLGRERLLFFVSGLFSLVLDWHEHDYDTSIDQMSALLMDLLMNKPIRNSHHDEPAML